MSECLPLILTNFKHTFHFFLGDKSYSSRRRVGLHHTQCTCFHSVCRLLLYLQKNKPYCWQLYNAWRWHLVGRSVKPVTYTCSDFQRFSTTKTYAYGWPWGSELDDFVVTTNSSRRDDTSTNHSTRVSVATTSRCVVATRSVSRRDGNLTTSSRRLTILVATTHRPITA